MKKTLGTLVIIAGMSTSGIVHAEETEDSLTDIRSYLLEERTGSTLPQSESTLNLSQWEETVQELEVYIERELTFNEYFYYQRNYLFGGGSIN